MSFFCCARTVRAATIIKLDLGGTGPDVSMTSGVFGTVNDGNAGTTGDQNTAVEYTDFLDFIPDITLPVASYTLSGLQEVGPATVFGGSLVSQNFVGGQFSLYDPSNTLLLQGPLINSALTGTLGPPGTGAIFSTTLTGVTGGTLAPFIVPGSISMSMEMTNVNGGAGFTIPGGSPFLGAFQADATTSISASPIPEPASLSLLLVAATPALLRRRTR
jgi:hypothetical protein